MRTIGKLLLLPAPIGDPQAIAEIIVDLLEHEEKRKELGCAAQRRAKGDERIGGDRTAPPKGGDGSPGAVGNVGGYNTGWLDPGSTFTVVDGEKRSSMIIDPPDGKVPALTPAAAKRPEDRPAHSPGSSTAAPCPAPME